MNERIKELAKELAAFASVQPMPDNIMKDLLSAGKNEKELVEQGYEPVSHHRILWIKSSDERTN